MTRLVLAAVLGLPLAGSAANVYPVPSCEERAAAGYAVTVDGETAPVSAVRQSAMPVNIRWPGHQRDLDQTEIGGLVRFAFEGSARVTVTAPKDFREVKIRPQSKGVKPSVRGRTVEFTLEKPGGYSVEFDGIHSNLHVFADPPAAYAVDRDAKDTIYFGPGEHDAGLIKLGTGQTLYIDEGAVVFGRVFARDADHIRILGRGILDGSRIKAEIRPIDPKLAEEQRRKGFALTNSRRYDEIRLEFCDDVEIDGITIRDSPLYNIRPICCRGLVIRNVKLCGNWRYNSDGIDMHNCENVRISDCFVRTFDDSICVKGFDYAMDEREMLHNGRLHDVFTNAVIERCTVWCDWGVSLEFGAETRAREIIDITFRDCDVIRCCGPACDVQNCDYADIHDVLYENIRVEMDSPVYGGVLSASAKEFDPTPIRDAVLPPVFSASIRVIPEYSKDGVRRGRNRDITLRDFSVISPRVPILDLKGYDRDHRITGVTVDGIRWNGREASEEVRRHQRVNEFAEPPRFTVAFSAFAGDAEKHNSTEMNAASAAGAFGENGGVKVVFIGNSITLHSPLEKIGWTNNWGMAASAPEKDYVHLVTRGIEKKTGRKAEVRVKNLAAFERDFRSYDLKKLDDLVAFRPDYLVVALGENVPELKAEEDRLAYRAAFKKLLGRFTYDRMQPNAVVRGSFWPNPGRDALMRHAASDYSIPFVRADECTDETVAGTNRFWHSGVAAHPGDRGMEMIARRILEGFFPEQAGFSATMDGRPVTVRPIRVSAMPFNQWAPGYQRPMDQTEIAGMINVEAAGATVWRVKPERAFTNAVVRPIARGIPTRIKDGEVAFTLPKPGYYVLELDDCHRPLEIFVNPPRDFAKERAEANIVFGPGLHEPVVVKLKSHDRVYIDRGAVVKASFQAAGVEDVVVSGYGIIDGGRNRRVGDHCYRDCMDGAVLVYDSKNVKFDGPVVLDSCCWMVSAFNSCDLEFANLKVTGAWRYNTDGIDICNSQRVWVHDSYVHSFDDTLVVKGNFTPECRKDPVEDVRFSDCVCWCGWGNTFEIGFETWAPSFRNVTFENCDAIRSSGTAISVHLGGPAQLENVTYRNLSVEFPLSNPAPQLQRSRDEVYLNKPRVYSPNLYCVTNGKMFDPKGGYANIVKMLGYDPKDDPYGNVNGLVISNISVFVEKGAPMPQGDVHPQPGSVFGDINVSNVRRK